MPETLFGDIAEPTNATIFGDAIIPEKTVEPQPLPDAEDRAAKVWDASIDLKVSTLEADQYFYDWQPADPSDIDFSKPVPDNRVGFSEEFVHQWTGKSAVTKIPIMGGLIGISQQADIVWAANRLTDAKFDYDQLNTRRNRRRGVTGKPPPSLSVETDRKIIADAIKELEFQFRGKTFGGKVAAGVSQLPTWMIEFAATGGLASIGDDVAQKAGEKLLRKYAKTKIGKIALKSAGLVTGAVVRTSVGLLPRVGEKAVTRQALIELGVASEEGWATSLAKAWSEMYIEALTEESGKFISKGAGAFTSKYTPRLKEAWMKITGGTADDFATRMFSKAGYQGILTELTEEEIATILFEVTGVSDREGSPGKRVWEGLKEDFELSNIGSKIVTLLVPAVVRRSMTMGVSLTKGVSVPLEAQQLEIAIKAGKVTFDTPQEAQDYAERAAEVAERMKRDVTINTDLTDNSVSFEEVKPEAEARLVHEMTFDELDDAARKANAGEPSTILFPVKALQSKEFITAEDTGRHIRTRMTRAEAEADENLLDRSEAGIQRAIGRTPTRTTKAIDTLKSKIEKEGFDPSRPVSLFMQSNGKIGISDGTHRVLVASELGIENIPIVLTPSMIKAEGFKALQKASKKFSPAQPTPAKSEGEPTPEEIAEKQKAKVKKLTDKVIAALKPVKFARQITPEFKPSLRVEIEKAKTKELGRRVGKSAEAAGKAKGEERLTSALGELRGPLTEYKHPDFPPISEIMSKKETDELHNDIWVRPHTDNHFAKLNTAQAWSKVVEGFIPTRGEILLLEKQWGKEFAKGLLRKLPFGDRAWDTAADISNFMRTMLAGGDASVAGRQLRVLGQLYPKEFAKAVKGGLDAYRSAKLSEIVRAEYEASEFHLEAKKYIKFFDPAGLESTEPADRPEWYVSHYPEKVPIVGHLIRMGNRNYVETVNMLTQSIWDKLRTQDRANSFEPTDAELALRGKWLMSMSGRPEIGGVVGRRLAPIAAGFFFAPRFAVSRFTSPLYLRHLASGDPVAREIGRNTAKAFASFIGTNIAILALLKLTFGDDIEIELDPRSPDWGKGRIGNTRIDLWAGYQQASRFLVQMVLGQYKTQAGKIKETERLETVGRFIRGKENPLVSLISDLYKGRTFEGDRPFSPPEGKMSEILDALQVPELIQGIGKEVYNRMLFMWVQDFVDASVNDGWPMGFTAGTLSFFGNNTSSYEDTAFTKRSKFKDRIAQSEHSKEWEDLNDKQQRRLERTYKDVFFEMDLQAKQEGARRDDYDFVGRMIEDEKKAGKKVYKQLSKENRKLLDGAGISLGLSRKIGAWQLNDERYEKYQNITAEILDEKLSRSSLESKTIKRRVTKIEIIVQIAKDKAKARVRREARTE